MNSAPSYASILDSNCSKGGRRPSHVGAGERFIALRESLELVCVCAWVWVLEGETEKRGRELFSL